MTLFEYSAQTIDGEPRSLAAYRGSVCLVVNVASECGFTPQYAGLEALYRRYRDRGFTVLAFPCNQFGHQEPGSDEAIAAFCHEQYHVTFPLFAKADVNGRQAHPLFAWLSRECPGILGTESIKWNFTKFLVDRSGRAVRRFAPSDTAETIEEELLAIFEREA